MNNPGDMKGKTSALGKKGKSDSEKLAFAYKTIHTVTLKSEIPPDWAYLQVLLLKDMDLRLTELKNVRV